MSAAVLSSEAPDISSSAPRRKSGRVSRKPEPFLSAPSPAGSGKRKRTADAEDDATTHDAPEEEEPDESSEGEPDEEELREQRRKKKTKTPSKKSASKKPRTNGETVSLTIRSATSNPKKPRKAPIRKSALVEEDADGLYGE